ncbi:MAG: PadR family transcriptional regulator [Gemmatimonadota bacterium]|jgi:transcriptional regulator
MTASPLPLLPGTLDVLVLASLEHGPRHGYDVADWIRSRSADALQIEDGALYTALHRLEKRGLLSAEWGVSDSRRKAKYYSLTSDGAVRLAEETRSWTRYASAVFRVLGRTVEVAGA